MVGSASSSPISVELTLDNKQMPMEVNTGAAVSIMSTDTLNTHFPDKHLNPSLVVLKMYTGEPMKVLELKVLVPYKQQAPKELPLIIIEGNGPSLIGRNWLHHIHLNWSQIKAIQVRQDPLPSLLNNFSDVFAEELGTIQSVQVKLSMLQPIPNSAS